MPRPTFATVLFTCAALLPVACGNNNNTTTAPTPPAVSITEPPFTGTLNRNGGVVQPFAATRAGTTSATIVSLSPDSAAVVGLAIGTWNGSSCALTIVKTDATTASAVVGSTTAAGAFCVYIFDAGGKLAQPTNFEVSISHF